MHLESIMNGRRQLLLIASVEVLVLLSLAAALVARADWRNLLAVPFRGVFTLPLLFLIFRGHRWARYFLGVLFVWTSLVGFAVLYFDLGNLALHQRLIAIGIALAYLVCAWLLFRSRSITTFMAERRRT